MVVEVASSDLEHKKDTETGGLVHYESVLQCISYVWYWELVGVVLQDCREPAESWKAFIYCMTLSVVMPWLAENKKLWV